MEQRVAKIETDVAVLGTRLDTAEAEITTIRSDIKALSSKMDKATGIVLIGIALAQVAGSIFINQ
jgi:hypothetical protein